MAKHRTVELGAIFTQHEMKTLAGIYRRTRKGYDTIEFRRIAKQKVITEKKISKLAAEGYEFDADFLCYAVFYAFYATDSTMDKKE